MCSFKNKNKKRKESFMAEYSALRDHSHLHLLQQVERVPLIWLLVTTVYLTN